MIKDTKKTLLIALVGILVYGLTSCTSYKTGVFNRTKKASKLLTNLHKNNSKGIMLGHQDDLAYGIGWKYKGNKEYSSDVYKATGQFPAVVGWDIGKIGNPLNIDSVPFNHMKELILKSYKKGIINTISWHPFLLNDSITSWDTHTNVVSTLLPGGKNHKELLFKLDKVADFITSLKRNKTKQIPIIFRPWHEMNGNWFWWGENYCTEEDYKQLFVFTIEYLKNIKKVENMIVAYSPDRKFYSEKEYLKWYPGDAYVDILGVDNYYDFRQEGEGLTAVVNKLNIVTSLAEKKGKLAAFTETGSDRIESNTWFTEKLEKVLLENDLMSKLSYVLLWRNRDTGHFYVPHKGHPAFQNFINFTKNPKVQLLRK